MINLDMIFFINFFFLKDLCFIADNAHKIQHNTIEAYCRGYAHVVITKQSRSRVASSSPPLSQ